jgi:hypothetical protein
MCFSSSTARIGFFPNEISALKSPMDLPNVCTSMYIHVRVHRMLTCVSWKPEVGLFSVFLGRAST